MRKKITIFGAGNVGASLGQLVVFSGIADLAMIDIAEGIAEGKALDLAQARPVYGSDSKVIGGSDPSLTRDADLVVITAGITRKPGMSREELLETNAKIVGQCASAVGQYAGNALVIVISNPLDVMTYVASEAGKLDRRKVMGMAGVLDSARFRHFLSEAIGGSVKDIQAMVLGGHGDEMVPLLSYAVWQGEKIQKLVPAEVLEKIVTRTKNAGAEIVSKLKTSAFYSPAASAFEMIKAIFGDEKRLLPCSAWLNGEYGVKGIYVGVPVILGSAGVEKVVELELTAQEKESFAKSCQAVRSSVEKLKGLKG